MSRKSGSITRERKISHHMVDMFFPLERTQDVQNRDAGESLLFLCIIIANPLRSYLFVMHANRLFPTNNEEKFSFSPSLLQV